MAQNALEVLPFTVTVTVLSSDHWHTEVEEHANENNALQGNEVARFPRSVAALNLTDNDDPSGENIALDSTGTGGSVTALITLRVIELLP